MGIETGRREPPKPIPSRGGRGNAIPQSPVSRQQCRAIPLRTTKPLETIDGQFVIVRSHGENDVHE
ncbi:hypothetical protein NJ7G_0952 [Natrinema sp. J7-2]|uniref:Uncharacterized protein n=1 Tax=Natrinema gari JCM 14663 TaxID=1230459 RepID=L9ZBY1_9EURY|nr:hypothetical protein NJ7G_0952 [Natrinema sp. J7-2]ELY83914.1 hypothetical protein C486_01764 [Natrinema gari JCM 14663]